MNTGESIITQLIGIADSFDQVDDLIFVASGCSAFDGKTVNIDLEHSKLEVFDDNEIGSTSKSFYIKVTLEPLPLP